MPWDKREYQRRWLAARRQAWLEVNGPCTDCGSWDDLEIDHIDPKTKEVTPSRVWSWSEERRNKELAKCTVRCVPCHAKKTAQEFGWKNGHGSEMMYRWGKCRCDLCRAYKTESDRKRYLQKKNQSGLV